MVATSESAGARHEAVTGEMTAAVDGLLGHTAGAVDEARKGIAAQGDAMLAMLGATQAALERAGRDSAAALAARIVAIEAQHGQGIERTQTLAASISALGGSADAMTEALKTGDVMATSAIETTERLLTALDAAAREIDETLFVV